MGLELIVVDDDRDNADSLCMLLETLGYRSQACYSPHDALSQCAIRQFDVAIVDVGMPALSGFDLCREFRNRGWRLPVILITGYHAANVAGEAMKAGAVTVLQKPVALEQVVRLIEATVRTRPPTATHRARQAPPDATA